MGEGMTVVMVLHELGPLADVLDRTVLLQDGRIVPHQPDPAHHHGGHEVAELARPHRHDTGLEAV